MDIVVNVSLYTAKITALTSEAIANDSYNFFSFW